MRRRFQPAALAFLGLSACLLTACDTGTRGLEPPPEAPPVPTITGLSTNEASVGDRLKFFGEGFVEAQFGWVDVHFVGEFRPKDGAAPNAVDLVVPLQLGVDGALTWERFGEYRVPFLPAGNKLGEFVGEIYAENQFFPGSKFFPEEEEASVVQEQPPLQLSFHVLPSLIVLDNRAFGDTFVADCVDPAITLLEVMRYALRVKALGFTPTSFEFVMGDGLLQIDEGNKEFIMNRGVTRFFAGADGKDEFAVVHRWSPAPRDTNGYVSYVSAKANGIGMSKGLIFPIIIRPWVYPAFESGGVVAELMQPDPVSSCIPGGPNSVQSTYQETTSETRRRDASTSVRRDYSQRLAVEHTESYQFAETNTFSETQSQSVRFSDSVTNKFTESTTDLFSSTSSRTRADQLNWENSSGTQDGTAFTTEGIDTVAVQDFTTRGIDVNGGLVVRGGENYGNEFGAVNVTGTRHSEQALVIGTTGRENYGRIIEQATNSATRGRNIQEGRSWGTTQTYSETLGFAQTRAFSRRQAFGEAIALSQSVRAALGTTDTEVITQESSESIGRDSQGFVWAGLQGMWYRQATRILFPGVLVALDYCGNGTAVGEVRFSEWTWAADLAYAEECPPPTNFLPAQCRIEPCVGD